MYTIVASSRIQRGNLLFTLHRSETGFPWCLSNALSIHIPWNVCLFCLSKCVWITPNILSKFCTRHTIHISAKTVYLINQYNADGLCAIAFVRFYASHRCGKSVRVVCQRKRVEWGALSCNGSHTHSVSYHDFNRLITKCVFTRTYGQVSILLATLPHPVLSPPIQTYQYLIITWRIPRPCARGLLCVLSRVRKVDFSGHTETNCTAGHYKNESRLTCTNKTKLRHRMLYITW